VSAWLRALGLAGALLGAGPSATSAQASGQAATPQVSNLAGARDQPGLFTQRLLLPANFCGPLHTHDRDLHGLVLRGILRMGFADSAGRLEVREYSAGSFVVVPAGRRHVEGSPVETEIHLSGIGPMGTTVVDSTPGRCTPGQRN
jgi:quercetin dioxygenase-like cupin family protein